MSKRNVAGPACPECHCQNPLPILYGLPSEGMMEDYDNRTIALGGCCIGIDDPEWECRECGLRYHSLYNLDAELRQLVRMYYWQRDDFLKAEKMLRKRLNRLTTVDPADEEYRSLVHQQADALQDWLAMCQAFGEFIANLNLAMHTRIRNRVNSRTEITGES